MPSPIDRNAVLAQRKALRILLLEDSADDVEFCKRLLKKGYPGARCEVVQSRSEFSSHLWMNTYDVILADYALGNWTGMDAFKLMRDAGRNIPFILLTGALGDEKAIDCMKSGIADYILKDRPERLSIAIDRALKDKDLSEKHRQAVRELERSELRLRMLTDKIAAATFIEQGTRCRYVNHAAECITGYDREELLNMTFWDLLLPASRKTLSGLTDIHARNPYQPAYRYEIQILTKQGEVRCLDTTVGMFQNEGRAAVLITAFDISERNQRDIGERRILEDQVRQSQKMEALGQLSGGIAHDFNNLLGVIIGYAESVRDKLEQVNPLRGSADQILNAADRAASLTRQLLAFSRQQVLDFKPLDLNTLVSEMKTLLERLIGEDIELTTTLAPGPKIVRGDQGQLEQVIMNLAINARDAMPQGGKLVIETSIVTDTSFPFQIGPYVCLSITDSGTGMDADTKTRVFEPFFTTKEKGKGTGLGLSTVYGVVKQSGGYIDLISSLGAGTTFKIYVPQIVEAVEKVKKGSEAETFLRAGGNETMLVVEDEPSLRTLIRNTLEDHGYAVLEAKDGIEALIVAQNHRGEIHLLLADVVMPGMGGRMLAQELGRQRPGVNVVYMSGYTGQKAAQTPVDQTRFFLPKPFTRDGLVRTVREALDDSFAAKTAAELPPALRYEKEDAVPEENRQ